MDSSSLRTFFKGNFDLKEFLQTIYGLNYIELKTFEIVMQLKNADVNAVMEKLNRKDRVLVNRCLKTLTDNKLVMRKKTSAEGKRGYWYEYSAIDVGELKRQILDLIGNWHKIAVEKVEELDEWFGKDDQQD